MKLSEADKWRRIFEVPYNPYEMHVRVLQLIKVLEKVCHESEEWEEWYRATQTVATMTFQENKILKEIIAHCTETARMYEKYLETGVCPEDME